LSKLNIGILGYSSLAQKAIIPAILKSDKFNLCAIGRRDKNADIELPDSVRVCSYIELLEDHSLDAIYVSLPTSMHYEWGLKTLIAGKHLLLEKTFTISQHEANELIALSSKKGLVAMEALMYLHHPLFVKTKELISKVGDIHTIEAFFGFPSLPSGNFRNDYSLGGGAIMDALIYPLSFCLEIFDRTPDSYDFNINFDQEAGIDKNGTLILKYGAAVCFISYGFGLQYRNEYRIWGSDAIIHSNRVFSKPANMECKIAITSDNIVEELAVDAADHFCLMFIDFYNKIFDKTKSGLNVSGNILRRMEIISSIYKVSYT